mgnify:CR=1 FL=1
MGTMPILAPDGRYEFGQANQTDPGFGGHNWRTCIPDIYGGAIAKHTRNISLVSRKTMTADGAHKTKLAKEHHQLAPRKDNGTDIDTRMRGHKQAANTIIQRSR